MKINFKNMLFYLGYTLVIFSDMFSAVNVISEIVNYIDYCGLGILLFLIILRTNDEKYKIKKFFVLFFILAILIIVKYISNDNLLFKLFIIVTAFKNIDLNKYIRYDMFIRIIFMLIVVLLFKLGLTSTYNMYREDNSIRLSMGFSHPNNFGQYILVICCDYIFLKFNKMKVYNLIIPIIGMFLIYTLSNSRTSMLCIAALILFAIIGKFKITIFEKKCIKKIILNSCLIFTLLTFVLVFCYNQKYDFAIELNAILSKRIYYASEFLDKYNITLFGNEVNMIYTQFARQTGQQPWVLDNFYLVCILRYGIIVYFIVYLIVKRALKYCYAQKRYDIMIIWLILLLNGIFENYLFKIHFNPYLVILSYCMIPIHFKKKQGQLKD